MYSAVLSQEVLEGCGAKATKTTQFVGNTVMTKTKAYIFV